MWSPWRSAADEVGRKIAHLLSFPYVRGEARRAWQTAPSRSPWSMLRACLEDGTGRFARRLRPDTWFPTPTVARKRRWEAFLDALIADRELLTERIRDEHPRAASPPTGRSRTGSSTGAFGIDLDSTLTAARAGHEGVTDEQLAALTPVGEARARQGIPIADVLLAWRIGVQVVIDRATEIGPQAGHLRGRDAPLRQGADRAPRIARWRSSPARTATADLELATREHERRAAVVREALLGKIAPVVVRAHAESCGIDVEPGVRRDSRRRRARGANPA